MADNKNYIVKYYENGSVLISEDVIMTIVEHTVSEVDGVSGFTTKPGADIADIIGKKNWGKGVKIVIDENDALMIDCNIVVAYGQSVVCVANAVQSAVSSALESTIGVSVTSVNVNVCGIAQQ